MTNILVALVLVLIVGGAALYIYKEKKAGTACVGCPNAKSCASRSCKGGCGNSH